MTHSVPPITRIILPRTNESPHVDADADARDRRRAPTDREVVPPIASRLVFMRASGEARVVDADDDGARESSSIIHDGDDDDRRATRRRETTSRDGIGDVRGSSSRDALARKRRAKVTRGRSIDETRGRDEARGAKARAAEDAKSWLAFGGGQIDGSGVRLSVLVVLFLLFVIVTEWVRDREKEGMSARVYAERRAVATPTASGEDGVSVERSIAHRASENASGDDTGTGFRTYLDHGVVRLEGEVPRDDLDGGGHRVRRVREHRIERYPVDSVGEETTRERDGVVHHDRRVLYALSHGARVGFTRKGRGGDDDARAASRVEWMFTTPVLLILVFQLRRALVVGTERAQVSHRDVRSVVADEVMLVPGMLVNEMDGPRGAGSCLPSPRVPRRRCHPASGVSMFREMLLNELTKGDRTRFIILAIAKTVCWMSFPPSSSPRSSATSTRAPNMSGF